ncbi:MAG TPA: Bcr/CflA family multidrug efflux MFS transporter [Actinocrinis sp.]|nr:Bcr/CflA family multidrug efflux MFS transporter [Actinocrinis sp.]
MAGSPERRDDTDVTEQEQSRPPRPHGPGAARPRPQPVARAAVEPAAAPVPGAGTGPEILPEIELVAHPGPAHDPRRRLSLVLILGALSAFAPLSIDMYLPALPSLQGHFHSSAAQVQLTLTACLAGLAVGQVIAGPLSDSFGRRKPLIVGVGLYAVASLACAFVNSIAVLTAGRLIQGAAGAAGIVLSRAIVRDLYSGTAMVRFFSTLVLVNGAAPILAPIIGGQLLKFTDWEGVFVVLSVIGVLLLAAVLLGIPETLPAGRRRTGGLRDTAASFRVLVRDPYFVGYALVGAFAFSAMFGYISGSPFVMEQVYHLSPQGFSFMFGANAAGLMFLGFLNGRLVGRVSPTALMRLGLLQGAVGGAGLLAVTLAGLGFWPSAVFLWLVVSSLGLSSPNATALALAEHGSNAGAASALLGLTQFLLGALIGPLTAPGTGSVLAQTLPMALVVAPLALLALVVYLATGPLARRVAGGAQAARPAQADPA